MEVGIEVTRCCFIWTFSPISAVESKIINLFVHLIIYITALGIESTALTIIGKHFATELSGLVIFNL
jgi:hypothetical protein